MSRQSGMCPSGKVAYSTRREAHSAARRHRDLARGGHMRPYRCEHAWCQLWHLGHIPQAVMAGVKSASEIYTGASHG